MTAADRLHAALCAAWERLCDAFPDAAFERRAGYVWTICPQVPIPQFNGVWPEDDSAAAELDAALGELADRGMPQSVQVRRGRTAACETEAERLGLLVQATLPGMLVERDGLADVAVRGLELVEAVTADDFAQALAVAASGFGAPPEILAPLYGPELTGLPGLKVYLARAGGKDVATGVGLTVEGATGIFSVATPAEHRGRGYGAAVTVRAVRDGLAAGASFAWLQSSDMGHSLYRRLGFRDVETYLLYAAPEAAVAELTTPGTAEGA